MSDKVGEGAMGSGAKGYFSSGRGMPWPAHEYKSPDKTNEERNRQVPIDLNDLERPGKGPVNYEPNRGRKLDVPTAADNSKGDADIA